MLNSANVTLTKEAIASRMFRNAARFWGLNDTNMDNFDPLVRLLVEACAVEIYRLDNEVASLQRAMTERLANLLVPEAIIQPKPAHAIIHAPSSDDYHYVSMSSQFLHNKRISSIANGPLDASLEVFFSPAGRYKTISGDVGIIATQANVYRLNALQQKDVLSPYTNGRPFPTGIVWIGLEVSRGMDLSDVSFFFDLKIP